MHSAWCNRLFLRTIKKSVIPLLTGDYNYVIIITFILRAEIA